MRKNAGLEPDTNFSDGDVRIDAVEWSGFKNTRLNSDPSVIATVDFVACSGSAIKDKVNGADSGTRSHAIRTHPEKPCRIC